MLLDVTCTDKCISCMQKTLDARTADQTIKLKPVLQKLFPNYSIVTTLRNGVEIIDTAGTLAANPQGKKNFVNLMQRIASGTDSKLVINALNPAGDGAGKKWDAHQKAITAVQSIMSDLTTPPPC